MLGHFQGLQNINSVLYLKHFIYCYWMARYVCGGVTDNNQLLNLDLAGANNQWEDEGVNLPYDISFTAGVVVNGTVYIPGGQVSWRSQTIVSNHMLVWTPSTDAWKIASERLTQHRYQHCVVTDDDDFIWVIGGKTGTTTQTRIRNEYNRYFNVRQHDRLSSVEQYHISTGTWTTKPSIPVAVAEHACVYTQGMIIVSGGTTGYDEVSNKMYIYDIVKSTWSESTTHLEQPLHGHSMVILP